MNVLYGINGEIHAAIYDTDWPKYNNTRKNTLGKYVIDEVLPENDALMQDIAASMGKKDVNGNGKYYISAGELYERENWTEYMPEVM